MFHSVVHSRGDTATNAPRYLCASQRSSELALVSFRVCARSAPAPLLPGSLPVGALCLQPSGSRPVSGNNHSLCPALASACLRLAQVLAATQTPRSRRKMAESGLRSQAKCGAIIVVVRRRYANAFVRTNDSAATRPAHRMTLSMARVLPAPSKVCLCLSRPSFVTRIDDIRRAASERGLDG